MRLPEGAQLLLEVAEDYAVLLPGALEMTQVKASSGTVTLRTDGVRKALASLLQFQHANPNLEVRSVYLTTGEVGRENGSCLPKGVKGLEYWRSVARGGDVEPLRQLLLATQTDDELLNFVRQASAADLRRQLLEPIQWVAGSDDTDVTLRALEAKLETLAIRRTGYADDGRRALPFLVYRMLLASVGKVRVLTRDDFEREWEQATTLSVSFSFARQASAALSDGASDTVEIAPPFQPALASRLAMRAPLVADLGEELTESGVLWLHGSSNLGKSQLARLLVAQSSRQWRFVALKDCSDDEAQRRIRSAIGAIQQDDFGGIVLDDLPVPATEGLRSWVSAAARELAATKNGAIVVTSEREPLPQLRASFEPLRVVTRTAPYLLQEDVADIVKAAGGDPDAWALPIFLTCGMGHPWLVDARVAGLASRGWPSDELLAGLGVGAGPDEVVEVRKETALRLLDKLASDAHQLLLRLSVLLGPFDRELAMAVAEVSPAIIRPGVMFEFLAGPWIELRSDDRYTLSPLLQQAGAVGLGEAEKLAVQNAAIENLISRKPFPGDLLPGLILYAATLRDLRAFGFIAAAIVGTRHREVVAAHSFPLLFLTEPDGIRLVPEHAGVSILVRTAQVITAVNTPDCSSVASILAAAFVETDTLPEPLRSANRFTLLTAVLSGEELNASPQLWMPLLQQHHELVSSGTILEELLEAITDTDLGGLNAEQFYFIVRSRKIDDVGKLAELFEVLKEVDPVWRHQLLEASSKLFGGAPIFIQAAWSSAALADRLDAQNAADTYEVLAGMAAEWNEPDIEIECLRSRAVMFDEYLQDSAQALAVLDAAEKKYPANVRLARSRGTVLGRAGRHQEELAILSGISDNYSLDEPLERLMMLRTAAISAAKLGRFEEGARLFQMAGELTSQAVSLHEGVGPGLAADAAVMKLLAGDGLAAVRLFESALLALEKIDLDADDRVLFAREAIIQTIQWACAQTEGIEFPINMADGPGLCSTLQPNLPEPREAARPETFGWYPLARLEVLLDGDGTVFATLQDREASSGMLLTFSAAVRTTQLERAILLRDIEMFFRVLPQFAALFAALARARATSQISTTEFTKIELPAEVDWGEDEGQIARAAVSAIIAVYLIDGDDRAANEIAERANSTSSWLENLIGPESASDRISQGLTSLRWLLVNTQARPEDLLVESVHIFMWIATNGLSGPIGAIWPLLRQRWLDLVRERPALLALPRLARPSIETAADAEASLGAIAKLIQAAAIGTTVRLPPSVEAALQTAVTKYAGVGRA